MNRWKLMNGTRYHVDGQQEPVEVASVRPRYVLDLEVPGHVRLDGHFVDGWTRDGRRVSLDPDLFGDSVGLRRCSEHGVYDADLGPTCPGCGGPTEVTMTVVAKAERLAS